MSFPPAFIAGELLVLAACLAALFWRVVPAENAELVKTIATVIAMHLTTYVNFQWGSSQGSRDKDARGAEPPAPPLPPAPPAA